MALIKNLFRIDKDYKEYLFNLIFRILFEKKVYLIIVIFDSIVSFSVYRITNQFSSLLLHSLSSTILFATAMLPQKSKDRTYYFVLLFGLVHTLEVSAISAHLNIFSPEYNIKSKSLPTQVLLPWLLSFAPSKALSFIIGATLSSINIILYAFLLPTVFLDVFPQAITMVGAGCFVSVLLNQIVRFKYESELRGKTISSILDNIRVGVFSISNGKTLRIDKERSRSMAEILGFTSDAELDRHTLKTGFLDKSSLDDDYKQLIASIVVASLNDHILTFEVNASNLPLEIEITVPNNHVRHIEIDWNVILGSDNITVKKILVSCKDVTELRRYRAQVQESSLQLQKISELISVEHLAFCNFYTATQLSINHILKLADPRNNHLTSRTLDLIFFHIHTIKGAARTLGLKNLASILHAIEDKIVQMRNEQTISSEDIQKHCVSIKDSLEEYRLIGKEKLNRVEGADEYIRISRTALRQFLDSSLLGKTLSRSDLHLLVSSVYVCANKLLVDNAQAIINLTTELSKCPTKIEGIGLENVYFTAEAYNELASVFTHLVRNSIDHGIETLEERIEKGKPENAMIVVQSRNANDGLYLTISDDGRGLAIKKILERNAHNEEFANEQQINAQQIAELIFKPGLTTANLITEISGRGIGMSAVRTIISGLGGSINIIIKNCDENFAQFAFELFIPIQHLRIFQLQPEVPLTSMVPQ